MIFKLLSAIFLKRPTPSNDLNKLEVKPYMKTSNVCAMDMDSFRNSKEVKRQCELASKLFKEHNK